jgi:hypothetical protein
MLRKRYGNNEEKVLQAKWCQRFSGFIWEGGNCSGTKFCPRKFFTFRVLP